MEVGAVKQAFNNELILLKKKLNQAKTNVIHKLTRKAKTFVEKKAPEPLKEKLKRKAESAVKEVLIIKKIKARDIGRFIVTHTGELSVFLNKPQVDNDKACARLLLHKALQDKYKFIRNRFKDVPIKDLFMSRQERQKIKKEMRENQKNKNKKKNNSSVTQAITAGDWEVEDIGNDSKRTKGKGLTSDGEDSLTEAENLVSDNGIEQESDSDSNTEFKPVEDIDIHNESEPKVEHKEDDEDELEFQGEEDTESESEFKQFEKDSASEPECSDRESSNDDDDVDKKNKRNVKVSPSNNSFKLKSNNSLQISENVQIKIENKFKLIEKEIEKKQHKKQKDISKNKNFNEKILNRKFKKNIQEIPAQQKIVDPFFITATGGNYMSVVEPRPPDEVKEVHKQGNRKMRRAAMFGHVPRIKRRSNNTDNKYNTNRSNNFIKNDSQSFEKQSSFNRKSNEKEENVRDKHFKSKTMWNKNNQEDSKPEKLHPSWEAKKKQSGILPFQGKKIVFSES